MKRTVKTFLLDTNVLIHDPRSIYNFQEHDVVIPVEVLEELDRFKSEPGERGQNSRSVHRELTKLFSSTPDAMQRGVPLPAGGTLHVAINRFLVEAPYGDETRWARFRRLFPDLTKNDNRILGCAVYLASTRKGRFVVVTKDMNMQLKALSLGMHAEDYLTDKVKELPDIERGSREVHVDAYELQRFASTGSLEIEGERGRHLDINEYILLRNVDGQHTLPARHLGRGEIVRLNLPSAVRAFNGVPVKPRNLEQQFMIDALLDPSLALVTCYGRAGTGKTILSIACGLHLVAEQAYDGLSITRPVMPLGRDIGFLPGDLNEKMMPWLQPYYDALNLILPPKPPVEPQFQQKKKSRRHGEPGFGDVVHGPTQGGGNGPVSRAKPYERLLDSGILEIEALTFIRGRSIPRRYFILDEAQQLTPHEVKTVISRMSEGSKLVLIGDPTQIDNPYVDAQSNGLVYARNKLANQRLAAHIRLTRGERSPLSDLAVKLM